jgi:phosphoenolpyruvate synthase/pyruvate phosphate dikinase
VTHLTLDQATDRGVGEVGGKARGLARLLALGLPVPPAVVVPADVHERWLAKGALGDADVGSLWAAARSLGQPLAVRSSAVHEDSASHSAAGQYESVMDVCGPEALAKAIERCYRAADSERVRAYRSGGGASVALVVQREIVADRSGVAFSVDPVSGARESVVIEAAFGHGEGIVSGEVAPDRYVVARGRAAVRARVADKAAMADGRGRLVPLPPERRLARVLHDHEARAIARLVEVAEVGFAAPVDVEFCFSGTELWLVQGRPITTLDAVG